MEIIHEWQNGPELLFAKCDGERAREELSRLEPILKKPDETGGAVKENGEQKKDNRGIFFQDIFNPDYAECSPTSLIIEEFVKKSQECEFTPNSIMQSLYSISGFNILFSAYRDGDYYEAHRDIAKLTILLWLGQKDFDGGDLYLPDFDYTIPYEQNKLIMMPSFYRHEVTKISTDQEGFVRYCASAFIN